MIVQHNMTALNANRQLGITNTNLARSTEKLSSGYRINRASDDAAGLSISEKMRGQIRGLKQASTNAQDGQSLIQTAEGAMNEIHSVLQRMRELTVQAKNDTYLSEDRAKIQTEMKQLQSEITRIATQTQFNKMNLLNGSFQSKQLQVGANDGQVISFSINTMSAKALGVSGIASAIRKAKGADIGTQLTTIDDAITKVSTARSDLGAISNRLDHTIANADNMAENLQSSETSGAEENPCAQRRITPGKEKGGLCMKKKWTIATVLLLAVALLAVGTWAYFSAVGTADNVITMGSVKLALHDEDGNGDPFTTVRVMPGSVVNKVVYVENVGTGAFYTRVKITPEILNADSERMPLDPSEHLLVLDLNDTDWIAGADGYYYYNGAVDPKTATTQLFSRVTFSTKMGNEYQNSTVHIYVTAEAVQTANLEQYAANDVRDVWKHVGAVEASTSSTQIDPIPTP